MKRAGYRTVEAPPTKELTKAELHEHLTNDETAKRKHAQPNETHYYVYKEVWENEVCKGYPAMATAQELAARGLLKPGDGRNLKAKLPSCPEGKNLRFIHITEAILDDDEADPTL
jgi:uncharacterized protein (DUF927 family)